jgi:hypothetical protein
MGEIQYCNVHINSVPNTTSRTPEDECKCSFFTNILYILLKQIHTVRHGLWLQSFRLWQIIAHDSRMIHTLCIRVSWCHAELVLQAFWHLRTSNLLHCLMPTVRFPPPPDGPGPPLSPALKMASLPPGSTHISVLLSASNSITGFTGIVTRLLRLTFFLSQTFPGIIINV